MKRLPDQLVNYASSPMFSESSIPAALLKDHRTKRGTWALIRLDRGRLALKMATTDGTIEQEVIELTPERPCVIEPSVPHAIESLGEVAFQVEFWR